EDIAPLARRFLAESTSRFSLPPRHLSATGLEALLDHDWPGNVRELRNRIERAAALADGPEIGVVDLFPEMRLDDETLAPPAGIEETAREAVRRRVMEALARAGGNRTEAARLLGVSRTTIWKYSRP